ncbi:MAG TPA: MlaE family lipid ABC transporter permease subunit [Bauldia sp.]
MSAEPLFEIASEGDRLRLVASGAWTTDHADRLEQLVDARAIGGSGTQSAEVDIAGIEKIDTFGTWLLERTVRRLEAAGTTARLTEIPDRYRGMFDKVHAANRQPLPEAQKERGVVARIEQIGEGAVGVGWDLLGLVDTLGAIVLASARALRRPRNFRVTSIVHHLDRVGWQAIGIILLITFLIGCIIAQQGIFNFRKFGAEDYVVNLVGILVVREIGVLIVAIMVAGRSGSSYTAELGSMKMREEIDALRTMGVDPVEVLVLPRIIAMIIALPVLTFLGSIAALFGGEIVSALYGGMSPAIYLSRLKDVITVGDFEVGMIKAPVMALIIGVVACTEGLRVKGSAESLGLQTTASVVKSIFLVIVLDGVFAIFFAAIGM